MNVEASDLWERAKKALLVARSNLALDPDAAASRAYYAAFYAVSALLALQGKTFTKHSFVEAAVHRDLVKAGPWSQALGREYARLVGLRNTGDYGGSQHVSSRDAAESVEAAEQILQAVADAQPEIFTGLDWT